MCSLVLLQIFNRLGISNKKNYHRLTNMISKYGLQLQVNTYKRSNQYRIWLPQDSNPQVDTGCTKANKHKQDSQAKCTGKHEASVSDASPLIPERYLPPPDVISDKSYGNETPVLELKMVPNSKAKNSEANESPVLQGFRAPVASHNSLPIAFTKCN